MGGRFWTEYEKAWLAQVWPKTGIPAEAIAHALKRTRTAVKVNAYRLKIKRFWVGSPENLEVLKRMRKILQESGYSNSPENLEVLKQARKKSQETWIGSPEQKEHLKQVQENWNGSPEQKEHLKRARKKAWVNSPKQLEQLKQARKNLRAKPTWPEAVFYGLVFGYDGLAEEFYAQELIPTTVCNHTIDGRWRDVILELDGGGHNIYRDVTEHDLLVDAEYQKMGYRVVRAESSSDLFLRFLQVIEVEEGHMLPTSLK